MKTDRLDGGILHKTRANLWITSPFGAFCGAAVLGAVMLISLAHLLFGGDAVTNNLPLALGAYAVAAAGFGWLLWRDFPHDRLGLCNLVTLLRLVLVAVMAVGMLDGTPPGGLLLTLAAVCLSLDGVDGWLARRSGLVSDFGARFDVEVDALFALLLAVYAARIGAAPPFVILLGLPHYLFTVAGWLLPWLHQPLPPKFSRKAVCVLQIGALIAFLIPQLAGGPRDVLLLGVTLALLWSFGRDILWLAKARG